MSSNSTQQILNSVRRSSGLAIAGIESTQQAFAAVYDPTKECLRIDLDSSSDVLLRVAALENTYVRCVWYAIVSGTTGSYTPPTHAKIVLDAWPEGIDAIPSLADSSGLFPNYKTPITGGGAVITAILSLNPGTGDYTDFTLSGTPSGGWPICLIYTYRTPLLYLDYSKTLTTPTIEGSWVIKNKGDLITGTGSGNFTNLVVGADTYLLQANSAQPTGLIWTNPNTLTVSNSDMVDGSHASAFAVIAHTHTHASTTGQTANDHHSQSHAITSTSDHTSTATSGKMLQANANGLPIDATNTNVEVAAAVTASHAAVTVSDTASVDLTVVGQQISAVVLPAGVDHGGLGGLIDDDHTLYHTDGRALIWHSGLSGAHVTNGNSHDHVGGDGAQIAYSGLSGLPTLGTAAAKNIPAVGNAAVTEVVYGTDTRLTDARTPSSHTHGGGDITSQVSDSDKLDGNHASAFAISSHTHTHASTTGQTANDHHAQAHALNGADHTVSGLTPGHFLKAIGTTSFNFAAHGLTYSDVGAEPLGSPISKAFAWMIG